MAEKVGEERRSRVGYGSSYRKGDGRDLGTRPEIGTVLGGQVWMVKPDKLAKHCLQYPLISGIKPSV